MMSTRLCAGRCAFLVPLVSVAMVSAAEQLSNHSVAHETRSTTIILDDTLVWPSAASNFTLPSAQSLPVLVLLIALGMASHRVGFITRARTDWCRWTIFRFALPALTLVSLWSASVDKNLVSIGLCGTLFCASKLALSRTLARHLARDETQKQGWLLLTSQGDMLSLLYPLLLSAPDLGENSLAASCSASRLSTPSPHNAK